MNDNIDEETEREAADELLEFVSRAERLESFPRAGWMTGGVNDPESVSAHLYGVAVIALWFADRIEERGDEVDTERVLRIALLHDIGEALLTDLPRPVKQYIGRFTDEGGDVVEKAEFAAADTIVGHLGDGWLDAVESYNALDSLEARIVKVSDRIQMLAKSLQYRSQNRGDTDRFWEVEANFDDYDVPFARAVFDRLREHHESGEWYPNDFE